MEVNNQVRAWDEKVTIPTYGIGKPEKNPMFLEKRVYQGSSGVVYPHPVIEKILDEKTDQEWNAVFLENKYLKIMILPELGGRIQMAFDKTKNRHFIYYNQVIKPALVGLTGPWISGGIEFNWPQHHRPSTYLPVEHTIEEHPDGSVTVWCSEVERMFRTRGLTGFRLYPDKSYLEINVKLFNRTPYPQSFLWWANPAVKVNDHYQSVFPPDVHAVFDHGKRDVSRFPLATGTYYKVDYSAGVDISRYKNIPVPTSYMAIRSDYNFVGGYENDSKGGLLHVANHHVSPGKKQWTWGNGDFGKAWDRNLTDEDGPYIELMCGVYTDNQPDFSWLMPNEEKSFSQYFMPYRDLGVVKNATKEAMVNLEFSENRAIVKVYTTAVYRQAKIIMKEGSEVFREKQFDLSPELSFTTTVDLPEDVIADRVSVEVRTADNRLLVGWKPDPVSIKPLPDAASPALLPQQISSIEQLYLTGLHLEQYRHATFFAEDYYREALSRERGDARCNNALGLLLMRRGEFAAAEEHFKTAIDTLTERNPNPYDGEPFYHMGLVLRFQNRDEEAFSYFYKSVWNAACQDAGYLQLAQIAAPNDYIEALELVDRSLARNWHSAKARHLKTMLLRKTGQTHQALQWAEESLLLDRFNFGILYEKYLLSLKLEDLDNLKALLNGNFHTAIEFSLDYYWAGIPSEAFHFLQSVIDIASSNYPTLFYLSGWYEWQSGNREAAAVWFSKGENAPSDYCFPHRNEELLALGAAICCNPKNGRAHYYLGNLFYACRRYNDALAHWEIAEKLDDNFPTVKRNLALAYYNQFDRKAEATLKLEEAFQLDKCDFRILMELDQLYKKQNRLPEWRLAILEQYPEALSFRDDLCLEQIALLNHLGHHERAYAWLTGRKFHPWEGGEGKVTGQYLLALTELAKTALEQKDAVMALHWLSLTESFPENLGEGKLYGAQENDIDYWKGCALAMLRKSVQAREAWIKASSGLIEPSAAMFYNDQQPDKIFYQGMALLKLGDHDGALNRFNRLIDWGGKHLFDEVRVDYFAVSLPDLQIWDDSLTLRNKLHCLYLLGLGNLGKGNLNSAESYFRELLQYDRYHQGARLHLKMCR